MAATEQVLSTLARLGNLGLGGVETPENRPSEQDSSLFSALLEESGGGNRSPEDKPAARKTEDDGNGLPALPVAMPIATPVTTPVAEKAPAEDSELEDFAVKLGIDRSLARLLLTQTSGAPAADATMAPVATPDVSGFNAAFQNAALPNVLPTATAESAGLSSAGFTASLLAAGAANVADVDQTPISDAAIGAAAIDDAGIADVVVREIVGAKQIHTKPEPISVQPDVDLSRVTTAAVSIEKNSMSAATEVDPAVATPPSAPTLTQLDLARLTGASASIALTNASARDSKIVPPALNAAPESLTPIAAAPLGDEDLLRWRSIAARAAPVTGKLDSAAAVAAAAPTATAPTEVAAAEVATTLVDGVKDRFATKDVGNRTTRTKDMVRGREAQTNADELLGISSLRTMTLDHAVSKAPMLASTLGVMTLQTATPSVVHPDAGPTTPGFAIDTGATAVTQSTSGGASGGIMNEPLRMPEPKLDFATRAEMFADQVAQRVLGQIRNQAYDVSLQIDPRNLGPMDISLRVDGAKVTANVAVTHPEVRGLLESGLPRLRESLESAGLSLTNWSFAQSGSRDSSGARQGGGSAAGEMRRVSRVTDEADTGVAVNA
ncbi:MAG: flagellar hook-length control protein FliK, partial [Gammaproteobacteria bacterium]|nr:flagellar hook-length control protein FliK [Gammaproteobacteria bacterium]